MCLGMQRRWCQLLEEDIPLTSALRDMTGAPPAEGAVGGRWVGMKEVT